MIIRRNKTTLLIVAAIVAVATVTTLILLFSLSPKNLSDLERISFEEKTEDIANFLELFDSEQNQEDYDDSDISAEDIAKYKKQSQMISFAAQLNHAKTNSNNISIDEVLSIINQHFSDGLTRDDLENNELMRFSSPYNVSCQKEEDKCSFSNPYSTKKAVVASPIQKYILKSATRKGKEYFAVYTKYTISSPYDALNVTSQQDISSKYSVNDYLEGHGTQLSIKELINSNNISEIAEQEKELTVIYELKDDKIVFKNIK